MGTRRGQALMELAMGMFALALVVSALCGFAVYIARSLRAQNELRAGLGPSGGSNVRSDAVEVGAFASEHVFGTETLGIKEKVEMPPTAILK